MIELRDWEQNTPLRIRYIVNSNTMAGKNSVISQILGHDNVPLEVKSVNNFGNFRLALKDRSWSLNYAKNLLCKRNSAPFFEIRSHRRKTVIQYFGESGVVTGIVFLLPNYVPLISFIIEELFCEESDYKQIIPRNARTIF